MGRRPSERVDEAFEIWSTEANLNDTRTAQIMGIPQETVSYWHRTYGWDARYLSFDGPGAGQMASLAQATIRSSLPAVTTRLLHIATATKAVQDAEGTVTGEVYASTDRDAIQAAKLLYQYGFDPEMAGNGSGVYEAASYVSDDDRIDTSGWGELDDQDFVMRMIEANVAATNTRTNPRRKRA